MKPQQKKTDLIKRTINLAAAGLEVRRDANGEPSRTITGYAIRFNEPSQVLWSDATCDAREMIAPEAVTRELLDACDIKMTLFHNSNLLLARSCKGSGTLSYEIDSAGVRFSFEAPHTADGDKALELVARGDIAGCSFAFNTYYWDRDFVECSVTTDADGKMHKLFTVRAITEIHDFTLTDAPAYPTTEVSARSLMEQLIGPDEPEPELHHTPESLRHAAEIKAIN